MSLKLLALFALTELVLSLTPGPAVLLVISQGIRRGLSSSIISALGILTGNAVYFVLSAVGLGVLLKASAPLFEVIRWAGVAYLIFTGVRILWSTFRRAKTDADEVEPAREAADRPQAFAYGLLTQLLNPKAIVFFTALLPQFVSTDGNLPVQFGILAVTSIAVEFVVLTLYGYFADKSRSLIAKGKYASWSDRIAGTCLIGVGVSLGLAPRG
jgi:RhtB (resistance to homoserine/threonine) family protein